MSKEVQKHDHFADFDNKNFVNSFFDKPPMC